MCDQHNQSDIVVLSDVDDDDDVNREINLRIIWGTKIVRIPLRQVRITFYMYSTVSFNSLSVTSTL